MAERVIPKEAIFALDPDELLDFEVRWTNWLADVSDSIVTGTFRILFGNGQMLKVQEQQTATSMFVWLASGTMHQWYEIENRIITSAGRRPKRTLRIKAVPK